MRGGEVLLHKRVPTFSSQVIHGFARSIYKLDLTALCTLLTSTTRSLAITKFHWIILDEIDIAEESGESFTRVSESKRNRNPTIASSLTPVLTPQ